VFVNGKSIQNGQLFVGETREPTLEGSTQRCSFW